MIRHLRTIRRAAACLAVAAGLAAAAAACGPAPLSDVHEIVANSESAMTKVQTAHVRIEAGGQMIVGVEPTTAPSQSPAASGSAPSIATPSTATPSATPSATASATPSSGGSGSASPEPVPTAASTSVPLDGTEAEGDVDFAHTAAKLTGRVPGLPGMDGDLIVLGSQAWTRVAGDPGYHTVDPTTLPLNPADGQQVLSVVQSILTLAAEPSLGATLVGNEKCAEGDCYHVRVSISAQSASEILGGSGSAVGEGTIDLWILRNGFHVARFEFHSSDPASGNVGIRFLMTDYDKEISIAPPPSQLVYPS